MTTHRRFATRALLVAGVAMLLTLSAGLAGCKHGYSTEDDPAAGGGATTELLAPLPGYAGTNFGRSRSLYPLAVGNHWHYLTRTRSQITTDAGPQPPQVEERQLAVEIVRTEQLGGLEYFVQFEVSLPATPPAGSEFRLRGSRFGLFEADLLRAPAGVTVDAAPVDPDAAGLAAYVDRTIVDPGQRAAFQRAAADVAAKLATLRSGAGGLQPRPQQGAEPGEITLLSYPVYAGARWVVRNEPRFGRVVVGAERIHLPLGTFAAWRIRGTSELYGTEDRVLFWYSHLGLLRVRFHAVADAVDNTGAVIGRVVFDSDQSLDEIHLERGGAALTAGAGAAE